MFELIAGQSPYKSPTDMGVNMAGNCIVDDAVCCEASRKEIVRRYYKCLCEQKITGTAKESELQAGAADESGRADHGGPESGKAGTRSAARPPAAHRLLSLS